MTGTTITVGGPPGSGKTTAAKEVARRLGRQHLSVGELFRQAAQARGVDLLAFGALAEKDETIDRGLDNAMIAHAGSHALLEGRVIGELLAERRLPVVRIGIFADEKTRAQRIASRENLPYDQVLAVMRAREASEAARFRHYYGLDPESFTYELRVDSTSLDRAGVVQTILQALPALLREA